MYTDGSQCEKGTGAGVVVFSNFMNDNPSAYSSYKLKCHMHASVFTAEFSLYGRIKCDRSGCK